MSRGLHGSPERAKMTNDRLAPVEREGRQAAHAIDEYLMGSSDLPR